MEQMTIFDFLYETKRVNKPIRMIELFAGYGSQYLAMKYIKKYAMPDLQVEHYKICEWAIKSIQAYNDLHVRDYKDYSKELTKEQVIDFLANKGVSKDYNTPLSTTQLSRERERELRTWYNNIIATNNLVNISNVKGEDLEIKDTDKYEYITSYSFPCQDLSLAGLGKGMEKGSGTRSSLLFEVERLLIETKEKPQILIMENVPQVRAEKNQSQLQLWLETLRTLGYTSYIENLIATDYGIPQTRNRSFMISFYGEYNYKFPEPMKLEKRLRDLLETNVDEKYFLSDKMVEFFMYNSEQNKEKGNGFRFTPKTEKEADIGKTITTRAGSRMDDNFIQNERLKETLNNNEEKLQDGAYIDTYNRAIQTEKAGTITTRTNAANNTFIASIPIKNATKTGYIMAEEGDGIDISSRMESHRGTVQKGKTQTIKTDGGGSNGVVVK